MAPTTSTKLANIFDSIVLSRVEEWRELLLAGDLAGFERALHSALMQLYGEIMRHLLQEAGSSGAFKKQLKALGLSFGLSRLRLRCARIQSGTGQWIEYQSYYATQADAGSQAVDRQLSYVYWGCVDRASPKYLSTACMMSIVCPSFEIASRAGRPS